MGITLGIDGIGGDRAENLEPPIRAMLACCSARSDVNYVLAVQEGVFFPQHPKNVEVVTVGLSDEKRTRIDESLAAHPGQDRKALEKKALQETAVEYFLDKKMPLVTAFNSQVGIPAIVRSRIPGIKRVALAPELPRDTSDTPFLFLDLGANSDMYIARDIDAPPSVPLDDLVESDPAQVKEYLRRQRDYNYKLLTRYLPSKQYERNAQDIAHFAQLGALYMEFRHERKKPKVGLLNIGTEEGKGNAFTEKCNDAIAQAAREGHFEYVGFAEPLDVCNLDVLVTDGFTGNVALKFTEKTIRYTKDKIPGLVRAVFKMLGKGGSTTKWEAAYILGLRSTVLKLHGAASTDSYTAALTRMTALSDRVCSGTGTSGAIYPTLAMAIEQEYLNRYAPEHKEVSEGTRRYLKDSTRKVFKPSSGSSL